MFPFGSPPRLYSFSLSCVKGFAWSPTCSFHVSCSCFTEAISSCNSPRILNKCCFCLCFWEFSSASCIVSISFEPLFSLCFGHILPVGAFLVWRSSALSPSPLWVCPGRRLHTLAASATRVPESGTLPRAPDCLSKCCFSSFTYSFMIFAGYL